MRVIDVRRPTDLALYMRLLRHARPYWAHIAGLFLLSLLSSPLALLAPLPLKIAVDSIVSSHPIPGLLGKVLPKSLTPHSIAVLALVAGLFVAIALLTQLQELGTSLLHTYSGEKLVMTFRAQLFQHVQRLSLSYHDLKSTSDSVYRIQYDAQAIQYIMIDGVIPFIAAGFMLAGMIYVTARFDWQLALVAVAISPALFLVLRASLQRARHQWDEVKRRESSALAVIQETLGALRVVKAFGQEEREQSRFIRQASEGMQARMRLAFIESTFGFCVGLIMAGGTAAVLFVGIRHVLLGILTLGELLLVMGYLVQLYEPLKTISRKTVSLQSHLASAERAFSVLDEVPDVKERPSARSVSRAVGTLTFRNVSFAYESDRPVLHNISFEIDAGSQVGIVGTTGAGKTTLMSLLIRFYDPTSGEVLLDGVDLRDYKLADLRNQFAMVLQEPVLFSASIAENIAYARPGSSDSSIVAAARAANAHEFIAKLPQGYATPVGERGMRLSGGERQRISLARAFLKDAPILILDEPTSSVDVHTEAGILEAMGRLMRDRTTFVITHRLTTLVHCDKWLQLEDGCLVRVGSGAPLATSGEFSIGYGGLIREGTSNL